MSDSYKVDYIIKNGTLIDGSGQKPFRGDIAIDNGKICKIGLDLEIPAKRILDAEGKAVCPGFIDCHTHDDLVLYRDPYNKPKLKQGVTTIIVGNCGFGPCPSQNETVNLLKDYAKPILGPEIINRTFESFSSYAQSLKELSKAINIAAFVAHGALYIHDNGFSKGALSEQSIINAQNLLSSAMSTGAIGLSAGFIYAPGCYCNTEDMIPLVDTVAKFKGLYCVHLRSESDYLDNSINEVLSTVAFSGASLHISHFKVIGKNNHGRMKNYISKIEKCISDGFDITYDMYPYTAGSTTMASLFPVETQTGGVENCINQLNNKENRERLKEQFRIPWKNTDNIALLSGWDNIYLSSLDSKKNVPNLGRSIADIAKERGLPPDEACLQIFEEENGKVGIILRSMHEQDMLDTIKSKNCFVGSDGLPVGSHPHPRLYGTFPTFLRVFVHEKKLLSIEEAIAKITSLPARRFGLKKRGQLSEGFNADIVIFDPEKFTDIATFEDPRRYPVGMDHVIVNGRMVVDHNEITEEKPGQFIPHERD